MAFTALSVSKIEQIWINSFLTNSMGTYYTSGYNSKCSNCKNKKSVCDGCLALFKLKQ